MGQTDLTQGNILKSLLRYAAPLIVSSLLQSLYGIVDTIVAGQFIGSAALSGLTNSNTVITMITQILFGLCNGGCILIGQYYGAKDMEQSHASTVTLFTGSLVLGVFTAFVMFVSSHGILTLLGAPAMEEAQTYLQTCAIGFFFVAVYNACAAALRAVGNSRAPLICIAVTAGVNIVLDILFVAGFGMGVFGAALATVIAQAMSAVVAAICLLRSPDLYGLRMKKLYMRRDKVRKELKLGIPCAVQMSVAAISWLSITFLLNRYGVEVSAGNGVSNKIKEVCQLVISTTSTAAATMVAQNIGAMQYDRAKKTMYSAMKVTVVMALCIIVIVELTAPFLAGIFSNDEATVAAAVRNLRIEIIGQLFYAVFLIYHSLMVGSGDTWFVFCSSFINCILVRTVLGVIFDHFWGLDGLYIACMIAPSSSIPFGLWYERSDRWRKTFIHEEA